MRFPVFARRSNPSVDRAIVRKSKSYVEQQVAIGRADWVDPEDPRKGIICREILYFGHRPLAPAPESLGMGPGEIPGVKFVPPRSAMSSTVPRSQYLGRRREIYGDWQLAMSLLPEHQSA